MQGWEHKRLESVPAAWKKRVHSIFEKKMTAALSVPGGTGQHSDAVKNANVWLLDTTERMAALRVPVNLSDSEICDMARKNARECMNLAIIAPNIYVMDAGQLRERMARFVEGYGIKAPGRDVLNAPAISRMTDEIWWRRALRVSQGRNIESEAIRLGFVHRNAEIYASDVTVERRGQQRRRNAKNLAETIAVNLDTDQEFTLAELAEKSTANPRIRHGELMTRISGFEAVAKGVGDVAEFVTITTPSKYHPKRTGANGKPIDNDKFEGATPRDAQRYLTKVWALIRAKLARMAVRVYGFRVAEPHHDGTPHWHMILFCMRSNLQTLRDVIRHYALREDGTEQGALKHRVTFESIDPRKGSAAGYIAKYVSKNIDGGNYQVQGDFEGGAHDAYVPTPRVEAWASTWGIRQFQQIGGAPVGIWRELRRTKAVDGMAGVTKEAIAAANVGNWERYTLLMGGATVKRSELPLRVAYREKDRPNRYGELGRVETCGITENLFDGVTFSRVYESTRYQWEIKRCASNIQKSAQSAEGVFKQSQREAKRFASAVNGNATGSTAQPLSPWTCVNNCTGESKQGVTSGKTSGSGRQGGFELAGGTYAHQGHGRGVHGADFGRIKGSFTGGSQTGEGRT